MAKSRKVSGGEGWSFEPAGGKIPEKENPSAPPESQKARIVVEKRPKGKVATVVTGFLLSDPDRKRLAAVLKKSCGAGGGEAPGRIELQGEHRDAVREFLLKKGWTVR